MNSINDLHDDPRLTAYALGELPLSECDQVEALLREDATARQLVDEIRETARVVEDRLKQDPLNAALRASQREQISHASHRPRLRISRKVVATLAAAAVIALSFSIFMPSLNRAREVAHYSRGGEYQPSTTPQQPADPNTEFPALKYDSESTAGKVQKSQQQANAPSNSGVVDLKDNSMLQAQVYPKVYQRMQAEEQRLTVLGTRAAAGPVTRAPNASPAGDGWDFGGGKKVADEFDGTRRARGGFNTESYDRIIDNAFLDVRQNPLSTFSIDVDTASYSNVRRFIKEMSQLPPKDAVRIEEMINYFPYSYPAPQGDAPFGAAIEVAGCPWNASNRLVRIALRGKEIAKENRPPSNLVFLIDVSGSMEPENKLPLLKRAMQRLVRELRENDRVAIVVYAGHSGLVLPSTSCDERNQRTILDALERLQAGGSTNGASGITLAYQVASESFIKNGTNRVILCTDGDFNVGVTNQGDLTRLIEDKTKSNVFLSVLGFGMGNVKDSTMEKLADKGNGNYAYIDNLREANKVLVEQMSGTLITIAKDVKIQVEFNPAKVGTYRLIGYENRMLAKEDFNDDKKDAGEIGAGHTVTALYEIAPVGARGDAPAVDALKYGATRPMNADANSDELLTVKLRYKSPEAPIEQGTSKLVEFPVKDSGATYASASRDFKFASAVASFGMILRDSQYKGNATLDAVIEMAQEGRGTDEAGYRGEFIELVRKAKTLQRR